jgi:hypothetical protein
LTLNLFMINAKEIRPNITLKRDAPFRGGFEGMLFFRLRWLRQSSAKGASLSFTLGVMSTNRHGLSRYIPADIALDVRRRSKFGCVICRCAIYQYEHIEPEFADARQHRAENICLLCGGCHDRVTRGRLSKETVRGKYEEVQRSDAIRRPFENLDLSTNSPSVVIGSATFEPSKCLFRINGENILAITPPQDGAGFPTLNGVF